MKTRVTVVIEYDNERDCPGFSGCMKALNGTVVAVQFNDALKAKKENEMTIAVRISAWGSGLAADAESTEVPSGMIGGTSRVRRPAVNSRRFRSLKRKSLRDRLQQFLGDLKSRRHFVLGR